MKITKYYFDEDADMLDLVIDFDEPRPAISVPVDDDEIFFLRLAQKRAKLLAQRL